MAGDHSIARNVNKDFLVHELNLKQVSNTTIFVKGKFFVLSPSVQNTYNWFDLRLVNLKQFDRKNQNGYLLIRFFDKFLLADLRSFMQAMVSKENYVKTKVSGIHWKYNIRLVNGRYIIINQRDKMQFIIEEVTIDELKENLNRVIENKTPSQKGSKPKAPESIQGEEVSIAELRKEISVLRKQISDVYQVNNVVPKLVSKKTKRQGLFEWILSLFKGN